MSPSATNTVENKKGKNKSKRNKKKKKKKKEKAKDHEPLIFTVRMPRFLECCIETNKPNTETEDKEENVITDGRVYSEEHKDIFGIRWRVLICHNFHQKMIKQGGNTINNSKNNGGSN